MKGLIGLALVASGGLMAIISLICAESINLIIVSVCMALMIPGVVLCYRSINKKDK